VDSEQNKVGGQVNLKDSLLLFSHPIGCRADSSSGDFVLDSRKRMLDGIRPSVLTVQYEPLLLNKDGWLH